jgi:hypothetical protein
VSFNILAIKNRIVGRTVIHPEIKTNQITAQLFWFPYKYPLLTFFTIDCACLTQVLVWYLNQPQIPGLKQSSACRIANTQTHTTIPGRL